jgi:hypothetical protein
LRNWRDKSLLDQWRLQYPDLICNHYYDIWHKKHSLPSYGFGELWTAIHFASQGYRFLYEPWLENFLLIPSVKLADLHTQFTQIFIANAGLSLYQFIRDEIARIHTKGQPDLFVYNNDGCFFVEVKRPGDSITQEQQFFINALSTSQYAIPVVLANLKPY